LPTPINSDAFDAYFSVGNKGDAFFSSDRNEDNSDLYRVKGFYMSREDSALLAQQLEDRLDSLKRAEELEKQRLAEEANQSKLPVTPEDSLQWISENIDSSSLARVNYFYNKWELLKKNQQEQIDSFISNVARNTDYILVIGNADNIGTEGNNRIVAQRRANIVAEKLIDGGISPNQIIIRNNGSKSPIAKNDTSKGRAQNRRTDLYIIRWDN
jgi:outer membrane protein OmpA-like peptidoglycan-associated protein